MELTLAKAVAVLIGLGLLWLVVSLPVRLPRQGGYQGGYPNRHPFSVDDNYAYGNRNQAPSQGAGCMPILAVIGFLAVCAACVMLGIALASRLPLQ